MYTQPHISSHFELWICKCRLFSIWNSTDICSTLAFIIHKKNYISELPLELQGLSSDLLDWFHGSTCSSARLAFLKVHFEFASIQSFASVARRLQSLARIDFALRYCTTNIPAGRKGKSTLLQQWVISREISLADGDCTLNNEINRKTLEEKVCQFQIWRFHLCDYNIQYAHHLRKPPWQFHWARCFYGLTAPFFRKLSWTKGKVESFTVKIKLLSRFYHFRGLWFTARWFACRGWIDCGVCFWARGLGVVALWWWWW